MSLTFKLGSLAIRTLAKPLSNYIKRNATQHENFRRLCVGFAQRLHRVDMRLRLGLLQDPAAIERQIQRELKEAEKKRLKDAAPTVKTEAQTKAEEAEMNKERKEVEDHVKAVNKAPRIRPLSENKAIETGANFIAETFLFLVAGGLILAESWRRDRKDKKQDAEVNDALATAEKEREEMKQKLELLQAEIEALMDNKKPFDSVRAAAIASLRQIPSTSGPSTATKDESKAGITSPPLPSDVSSENALTSGLATAGGPTQAAGSTSGSIPASPTQSSEATKVGVEVSNKPPTEGVQTTGASSSSSSLSSWIPTNWFGGGNSKSGAS